LNTSWKNKPFVARGDRSPVCILLGPTGVGKTQVLEESFYPGFEVISADSGQVYRGCDTGTAKPSSKLCEKIPHHLIDIIDPDCQFSVGDFVSRADSCVKEILGRGNIPVVSGGTAFYIKNFILGLSEAPPGDAKIREELENECKSKGLSAMFEMLESMDPESAAKINQQDKYRILRALEINRVSGKQRNIFAIGQKPREEYSFLLIGLARERKELLERINRRVDDMFSLGLPDEVRKLVDMGYKEQDPGLRGIGYAEFFPMFKGEYTLEEIREMIKLHTRQYAKRQMTFFRKLPDVLWFHPDSRKEIEGTVTRFLGKCS